MANNPEDKLASYSYVNISILTLPITSFSTDIHAVAAIRSLEKYENLAAGF